MKTLLTILVLALAVTAHANNPNSWGPINPATGVISNFFDETTPMNLTKSVVSNATTATALSGIRSWILGLNTNGFAPLSTTYYVSVVGNPTNETLAFGDGTSTNFVPLIASTAVTHSYSSASTNVPVFTVLGGSGGGMYAATNATVIATNSNIPYAIQAFDTAACYGATAGNASWMNGLKTWSLEFWVKGPWKSGTGNWGLIGLDQMYIMNHNGSTFYPVTTLSTGLKYADMGVLPAASTNWWHIALECDATNIYFYVGGTNVSALTSGQGTLSASASTFQINTYAGGASGVSSNAYSAIRISNICRHPGGVTFAPVCGGWTNDANVLGLWKLNDVSTTNADLASTPHTIIWGDTPTVNITGPCAQ